ncbi:MAG: hypothetical protein O7H41_04240 [Planctomycetota bacterium]|nr:hypothetical protein [Planctomycetota bacterium]
MTTKVQNNRAEGIRVLFEPWGDFRELGSGAVFSLHFQSEREGQPEIVEEEDGFVVWAWPTSTLIVRSGDRDVVRFETPVPGVPPGRSVREFLTSIFEEDISDESAT